MSHQSGIQASQGLLDAFSAAVQNGDARLLKISIVDESLNVTQTLSPAGTWQDDFPKIVDQFEEKVPCYIAYRLDEKGTHGFTWIFLCYVPDRAYVRDKMLYASTRASLRKALGDYYFVDEMYGTDKSEFTLDGYQKHQKSQAAAPALTEREEEIHRRRKEESGADIGVGTKKAHVHGVYFPLSSQAESQLKALNSGSVNYVQLKLDVEKETIELAMAETLQASQVGSKTPEDAPRFHFFRYHHSFEDNTMDSLIYIYSCPMKSKVKERMLYSSSKAAVVAVAAELGLDVVKNSEVSDAAELTEDFIYEELHPKKAEEKKAFKKPTKPGRPGTRRPGTSGDE